MSKYNRENPFMYLYEQKQTTLEQISTKAVKFMIIMLILAGISLIGCGITCVLYHQFYGVELLIIIGIALFIFIETIRAITIVNKNAKELNYMLFGDNYQNINLNNEKLLVDINFYNECIGNVTFMVNSIQMYTLMYSLFISYYLIKIMAYFIGGI